MATAWKRTSGARAIISTLKMKPAAAAPSEARTSSGPAFRSVCSLTMISSTAAAKPPPAASVNSDSPDAGADGVAGARLRATARPAKASGTTVRLSTGAATIPSATAVCPLAIPTATARANDIRAVDSASSRAPYRPKRRLPARKPRAKKLAANARTAVTRIQ